MSEFALKLIRENKKRKSKALDLGNTGLRKWPNDLFELDHLEVLILSNEVFDRKARFWRKSKNQGPHNLLYNIPKEIIQLKHLKELHLGGTGKIYDWGFKSYFTDIWKIDDVSILQHLTKLQYLYLRDNNIADISFINQLTQLKYLSLSGNSISDLSPLKDLIQLQYLDLKDNNITDCFFLEYLTLLRFLDFSFNNLTDISVLQNLTQLEDLDLYSNNIGDISVLQHLTKLESLNLNFNKVKDISSLQFLPQLRSLLLHSNLVSNISSLQLQTQIQSLDLSENKEIKDFSFLQNLNQLRDLRLDYNEITDITFLRPLTKLQNLGVMYNKITDISPLKHMTELHSLDLRNNEIKDVSVLKLLPELKYLYICSNNEIRNFSSLQHMPQLRHLTLSSNKQIQDFSFLQHLTQLSYLDLSDNEIEDISFLRYLPQLTRLKLNKNDIIDFSILQHLPDLQYLDLSSNKQIQDLSFIQNLLQLESLNLNSNEQIEDFSFLPRLTQLQYLYLSQNKISQKTLIQNLATLPKLSFLDIQGNKVEGIPTSLVNQPNCLRDLQNYFNAEQKGASVNRTLKLILVGDGFVGKTTLVKRLIENPKYEIKISETERTHGIIIKSWSVEGADISIQVWDFGGQEIFHSTHRLFLSSRTLYLLIWALETLEKDEEIRHKPEYWLDFIADLGPQSRVLVIQNMIDIHGVQKLAQEKDIVELYQNERQVLQFGNFLSVSASTGQKRMVLLEEIKDNLLEILSNHYETIPTSWLWVRNGIEELIAGGIQSISHEQFSKNCKKVDVQLEARDTLLRFLHDTGVLFYSKGLFNNKIILDQQWAVNAVYEILKSDRIKHQMLFNNYFEVSDARMVWPEHNEMEVNVFLSFMTSCEIAFQKEVAGNSRFIVPQLLPSFDLTRGKNWKGNYRVMHCRLIYPHLHRAIIERFIVKIAHVLTNNNQELWRDAIEIYDDGTESDALITSSEQSNEIYIRTWGNGQGIMLAKIKKVFDEIRTFKDRTTIYYSWDGNNWLEESKLGLGIRNGSRIVFGDENSFHVSNYRIFLQEFQEVTKTSELHTKVGTRPVFQPPQNVHSTINPKRIFISYARDNKSDLAILLNHLNPLRRRQQIIIWTDTDLVPSEEWDIRIKEELDRSDIILLLISAAFNGSDYIWEVEIKKAIERHKRGEAKVIPIALNFCDWSGQPYEDLQGPIRPSKPIYAYKNQDQAWLKVIQGIEKVIRIFDNPSG